MLVFIFLLLFYHSFCDIALYIAVYALNKQRSMSQPLRLKVILHGTQLCNIVAALCQRVTTLFQHCNAVLRQKIVVANRPV